MHKASLLLMAFCVLVLVVGCSQGSDTSTTTTSTTTDTKTPTPPATTPAAPTDTTTTTTTTTPATGTAPAGGTATAVSFTKDIKPMTDKYCMPCHGDGGKKGISFTKYKGDDDAKADKATFDKSAKELEGKQMPPAKAPQPTDDERAKLVAAMKGI